MEIFLAGLVLRSIDSVGKTLLVIQDLKKNNENLDECGPIHSRITSICYMLEQMKDMKTSYVTNNALNELIDCLSRLTEYLQFLRDKNIIIKALQYQKYKEILAEYNQQLDSLILKLNACHVIELKQDTTDLKLKLDTVLAHINNTNNMADRRESEDVKEIKSMIASLGQLNLVNMRDLSLARNTIISKSQSSKISYLRDVEVDMKAKCGTGSFGTVYLGKYGGMRVAVKVFHNMPFDDPQSNEIQTDSSALSKMVLRELKAFEKLQKCPYVCRFYGATSVHSQLAIVTDYLDNHSLSHWLYVDNECTINDKLNKIAIGIATGLEYLHSNNISHNDVKSANIMLDHLWEAKLIDFGMVQINNMSTLSNNTVIHTGTAQWRAPEYWSLTPESKKHRKDFPMKGDVFSFGIVIGEIFTKEMPWDQCGKEEMKEAVLMGLRPYEFNSPIFEVIQNCWKQFPQDRIDMSAAVISLEQLNSDSWSLIIHKERNNAEDSGFQESPTFNKKNEIIDPTDVQCTSETQVKGTFIGYYKDKKILIKKTKSAKVDELLKFKRNHLNLSTIIGALDDQLLLELIPNGSLAYWLHFQNEYIFTKDEKLIILKDISSALTFLHDHDLTHGCLNPSNIMFNHDFIVKLTDFYYSAIKPKTPTQRYKSHRQLSPMAYDVYCFALITGEIYTNKEPFPDLTDEQIASRTVNQLAYRESDVPEDLGKIIKNGLNGDMDILEAYTCLKHAIDDKYHVNIEVVVGTINEVRSKTVSTDSLKKIPKSSDSLNLVKSKSNDSLKSGDLSNDEMNSRLLLAEGAVHERQKDYKKAYNAYRKSADMSCPEAQYNLAQLYQKGLGSKKNMTEALFWFTKSAELGNLDSMYALATLYKYGGYLQMPNKEKAKFWFSKGAQLNHVECMYQLSKMSDKATRKELLMKCAEQKHEKSLKKLKISFRD